MADENNNLRLLSFLKDKKGVAGESGGQQKQTGVSLVELLAVVSIIGIISTIALMNMGSSKQQFRRQNVAQELKSAFERARFDSVKRRGENVGVDSRARVIVDATSFTLVTDVNQNGVLTDSVDSQVTNFSAQSISIASTLTLPATVYFNKRGEVTDSAGTSLSPSFLVCNPLCTISGGNSNANASNANLVLVTPSGTVNLLSGGSPIPNFAAPSPITAVTNTSQIKETVIIH